MMRSLLFSVGCVALILVPEWLLAQTFPSGGHIIQDDGVAVTPNRGVLNFTTNISCSDNAGSSATDCSATGGGGSSTPMTADIDQAEFQFTKGPVTMTTPTFPGNPAYIAGSDAVPRATQEWSVGPMNVCTTSSNVAQQNACNDDTDCVGTCERAGTAGTAAQETYDITFNQTRAAVFAQGFAQDNVWSMFCANLGPECDDNNPVNPNHHAVKHNWEIDYRPGGAANDDKRLTEWYLSFFPPSDTATEHANASHLRTPFWQTNMKPNDNRGSTANTILNSSVSLWVPPSSSGFTAGDYYVGGLWIGSNSYPRPIAGVTPASTGLNPQTAWTVHTGTSWGMDDPGMLAFRSTAGGDGGSSGTSASGNIGTASDTKYIADQEINSSIQVSNNQLGFGAASFGVCNGGGVPQGNEVLGERCIDNRDCNGGNFWHTSNFPGICVKGNGIDDNGTSDGVCLADATCNAGDCDGSVWDAGDACTINADCVSNNCTNSLCVAPLTYRDNIVSLCDAPLDGETRDDCDNNSGTVNSQCVDIQRFFINEAGATIVSRNATYYDDVPGSHSEAERMIFGYCSSDGGGSPEDEGRTCVVGSSQCASGTCVKPAHSFRLGDTILIDNILHFETDSETPLLHNQTSGLFGNGDELVGSADFMHSKFTVGGPRAMRIGLMQGMLFKSPSITAPSAGAHRLGGTHDGVIKIEDQWAYAATQGVITSDDWTPPAIWAKPHTALNVSSFEAPLLRFDTGNFNTGSWLIEDMRLWVDDTNNVWRQKFDSRATSETDGNVIMVSSGNVNTGVMHWGVSNGSSINTGLEVCANYALTCVDSDIMGSDGSGTTCATQVTSAVNFWAMCQ